MIATPGTNKAGGEEQAMKRQAGIGALLLVCVGIVLGATVFRSDIAQATGLAQSVTVNNTAAQAVPVREQSTDANGNIKVHEQGTVNVDVTNSSLSVAAAAPITDGGSQRAAYPDLPAMLSPAAIASGLSFGLSSHVNAVVLFYQGHRIAYFVGPGQGGDASANLVLARPIKFDEIDCAGVSGEFCTVGWIGNSP
jgi:hypothetical protein